MQSRTEDRPAEYIRQLEEENQRLRGRLKAADLEIKRIHNQLLLAKAAAKDAVDHIDAVSSALYIGATLRYGTPVQDGAMEAYFPCIDRKLSERYDVEMERDELNRILTVRVWRKEERHGTG